MQVLICRIRFCFVYNEDGDAVALEKSTNGFLDVQGEPDRLLTNPFLYTGIFTLYLFVGSHRLFKNPFVDSSAPTKLVLRVINTLICIHENENSDINNSDTILGVYIHYKLLIINTINPRIKSVKKLRKKRERFFEFWTI